MKKIFLTFILIFGIFAQQTWADPEIDLPNCDISTKTLKTTFTTWKNLKKDFKNSSGWFADAKSMYLKSCAMARAPSNAFSDRYVKFADEDVLKKCAEKGLTNCTIRSRNRFIRDDIFGFENYRGETGMEDEIKKNGLYYESCAVGVDLKKRNPNMCESLKNCMTVHEKDKRTLKLFGVLSSLYACQDSNKNLENSVPDDEKI